MSYRLSAPYPAPCRVFLACLVFTAAAGAAAAQQSPPSQQARTAPCSPQIAQAQAEEIAARLRELARTHPDEAARLARLAENGTRVTNAEAACRIYEDVLGQLAPRD